MTQLAITEKTKTAMDGIMQAVANPNVDPAKLHSLLDAQERILNRAAEEAFNRDFALMQEELPNLPKEGEIKNKEGRVQSTYVKFETIQKLVMPIVRKHGFSISYDVDESGEDILVRATIRHQEGHKEIKGPIRLPRDTSGSKNATQGVGSSVSYGKRHLVSAILDLDTSGEDDDAQSLHIQYITADQRDLILSTLDKNGKTAEALCKVLKIESITDIQAKWFDQVIARINGPKDAQ